MILGVVQARMISTRLPGKVMKKILDKPMLWYVVERLQYARMIEKVVISTSMNKADKEIILFAKQNNIDYYAGSELDLIDRIYQTGEKFRADIILRVTADCPLVDPKIADKVAKFYLNNRQRYDFVCNNLRPTFPHGLDLEIYPLSLLKRAWEEITAPFEREWFVLYLYFPHGKFRVGNVECEKDLSEYRWTVDYPEDFKLVSDIFEELYQPGKIFPMKDIVALMKQKPGLMELNESYHTSANAMRLEASKKSKTMGAQ